MAARILQIGIKGGGEVATGNSTKNSKRARSEAQIAAQFKPGQSGNPNGRPKVKAEDKAFLQAEGPRALQFINDTIYNEDAPWPVRKDCAFEIVARAYGKTPNPVIAEIHQNDVPVLTLDDMFSIAEEVLHEAGGPAASP